MESREPSNSTRDHAEETSDVHVCCANLDAKLVELGVIGCCANCDGAGRPGGLCGVRKNDRRKMRQNTKGDKRRNTDRLSWTTSMIVAFMVHERCLAAKTGDRPWSRPQSKVS